MKLANEKRLITMTVAFLVMAAVARGGELAVDGRASAFPSVAAAGRFVVVAWGGRTSAGATDVYIAVSRSAGTSFGAPVRVNVTAGDASLSGEQPPHVALTSRPGREPSIVVVWTAKASSGTRIVSARSDDGGKTFSHANPIAGSDAAGNRGWESIARDRRGGVFALWLDHRELAATPAQAGAMAHDGHQHAATDEDKKDGSARAQRSKLYFARANDASSVRSLTGGVCYCCKTALATGPDGSIYAAWRHVYSGNVRDIAFTVSRDGGATFEPPVRVSDDRWVLDGCPENGPALAVDGRGLVHVTWPTLLPAAARDADPVIALFHAVSRDARAFTPRQQLPTQGIPRHPQIALSADGSGLVAWDEQLDGTRRIAVAKVTLGAQGSASFTRLSAIVNGASPAATTSAATQTARGEYPVIGAVQGGFVVAWTEGPVDRSRIRVERIGIATTVPAK